MKPRTRFLFALSLLIIVSGIALYTFPARNREPLLFFPATINRDCAPWDGSAFTVSIPVQESILKISIYQSPAITRRVAFSFPDDSMTEGDALLLLPAGLPEQLSGKVTFYSVKESKPVEGEFELEMKAGQKFKGKFKAEWENLIAYCG